jgi:hypothetical protein
MKKEGALLGCPLFQSLVLKLFNLLADKFASLFTGCFKAFRNPECSIVS